MSSRTSTAPDNRVLAFLPGIEVSTILAWAPIAVLAIAPIAIAVKMLGPLTDPDTFWHLHTGQWLWDTWQFSGPDPWSKFSSRPFVLHEWLPELCYGLTVRLGGMGALAWLEATCAAALLLVVYSCSRKLASPLPASAVAIMAWLGASGSLVARPQMVTYVLLAVTTTAWIRCTRDGRPRWWIVPLTLFWACSHGLWLSGPMVGFFALAGLLLDRRHPPRLTRRLAMIPFFSVIAAALTPIGPRLLLLPFQVSGYGRFVAEWRPATLKDPCFLATLAMAAVCITVWCRRREPVPFTHLAILALGIGWALLYGRTVALGSMMLAPLSAQALESLMPAARAAYVISRRRERAMLLTGLASAATVTALLVPTVAQGVGDLVPGGLDRQLTALPMRTVVYNQYGTGGWLMLTHPALDPVVDERTEIYSLHYLDSYFDALQVKPGWAATVRTSGATVALLPDDSPLAFALSDQWQWRAIGHDRGFVLLTSAD